MKALDILINELEQSLPFIDQKKASVSKASVGWHMEHTLLAMIKMISAVQHSNPVEYKSSFNWKRSLVMAIGKMPRGRARVPDSVKPGEEVSEKTILPLLEKAKQKVEVLENLSRDKYFTHPVFKDLRLNHAKKFINIHTLHHINIINDILKS